MKKNNLLYTLLTFWFFLGNIYASPPKPFNITLGFPTQGIPTNQQGNIFLNISSIADYQSGNVELTLSAIPFVVPTSNVNSIVTTSNIKFNTHKKQISIPLIITDNGEYEIRATINLYTKNGIITRSKNFGVLAEKDLVWFGRDSIDHAVEEKIKYQINSDTSISPENKKQYYNKQINLEEKERSRKSRANAGLSFRNNRIYKINKKIAKNDILVFKAFWIGQGTGKLGTTTGDNSFPIHGAKITISDKDKDIGNNPLTPNITGYMVDGQFSFVAPRKDYSYKVVIETIFSGIKANGTIETAGSGIGSFNVVKQTSAGAVYNCESENVLSVTCNQAQTGSKASFSSWSAFHGMAEMVVQAKKQLKVSKGSGFKVIFDRQTGTSSFNGTDINMLLDDRYDWDVVAHEFGHAIAKETDAIDTNTGGKHNGSNQYDYAANTSTFNNKPKSLELAISEGFGTWFGGALMQNPSAKYNGKFKNIGDGKYDDTEDTGVNGIHENFDKNTDTPYFGEDTENASYRLLWDLMDSNNELNTRATCATCKDTVTLGLNGLWGVLNGSKVSNIIEFYAKILEKTYSTNVADLLKTGENNIAEKGLRGALNISYTFAEFGVAPYLELPVSKTKLDLVNDKSGPKFKWSQKKTGTLKGLNKYTLALYTFDLKTLVFSKTGITAKEYTLVEADIVNIKSTVDALSSPPSSLVAVIIGENDEAPNSGPYLSNPIQILLYDVDRTLVVVVDSSGSNSSTDPKNLRIKAAKETLRSLTSLAESQANNTVPDLAGAIDFDSSVTILSGLDDPDTVIPKLDSINSSGGTDIAAGITSAIQVLENTPTAGLITGIIKDKAAITVFTDGKNNNGDLPVIQAIVSATTKGIRVHYGFLSPFSFTKSKRASIPSDAPEGYVKPKILLKKANTLPATIEEAVLASGGVYALIGNAESQVAFVQQIENRGFTNSDNLDPGGQDVIGQTKTFDILTDPLLSRSFQFSGVLNENARIIIDTNGNFHPLIKVIDKNGAMIEVDNDADADGKIELIFTLPYTGDYHAEVTSQDNNSGQFSIFVDVQNTIINAPTQLSSPVSTLSIWSNILLGFILIFIAYVKTRRINC